MKRSLLFATIFLILFSVTSFSQWTSGYNPKITESGNYIELQFKGQVDSTAGTYVALTSNQFELGDVSSLESMTGSYLFTKSGSGAPNIFVNLLGSNDPSQTFPLVEQIVDTTNSETYSIFDTVLSNARPKYYKLYVKNGASGRDNSTFDIRLRIKRDPKLSD
jgi:hypothetical protein